MLSSLNTFGLLPTRIHNLKVIMTAILILQFSLVTISIQASDGPKLEKPSNSKSSSSSDSETSSSNKSTGKSKKQHPLVPALKLAKSSLQSLGNVNDYQAMFFKTELVRNRYVKHQARIKFRENPFSVYMGFEGPNKGREVLYVEGQNNGNLIAKEAGALGIVGGVSLNPKSPTAMGESRYPITDIGMKNLVTKLIAQWERESKYGECDVKIYNGTMPLKNSNIKLKIKVVDSKHPRKRRQFDYHHTRLVVDKEKNLPISVEQYGFPVAQGQKPPLIGKYVYFDVKTDIGLKNIDFDVRNPQYRFR